MNARRKETAIDLWISGLMDLWIDGVAQFRCMGVMRSLRLIIPFQQSSNPLIHQSIGPSRVWPHDH